MTTANELTHLDTKIDDLAHLRAYLLGSLLEFSKFFYKRLTKRDLIVSDPPGRESHHIALCRELTNLFYGRIPHHRLAVNMPPGYGKSLFCSMFVAWAEAHYPDSNFLYTSYSKDLAAKHTAFIKQIMDDELYKLIFGVSLRKDSKAKDNFMTTAGGVVSAGGAGGTITGKDAGLPGLDRCSGGLIIDDPIKPDDAHSDTVRGGMLRNYQETLHARPRGENVFILYIGQRIHEDDLGGFLADGKDIKPWTFLVLAALDDKDMSLYPEKDSRESLIAMREKSPYAFWSQYQQIPVPAGNALYKRDWIVQLRDEPKVFATFITADTAETEEKYNDATAFSFWGLYEIESMGIKTGQLGLHWIDCMEIRVEPAELKENFVDFWIQCGRYPVPPKIAAIEKKSTGVTLLSELKGMRGLEVQDIKRSVSSGSKSDRFIAIQSFLASRLISINENAKHKENTLNHLSKITANNTHRHDDIADTLVDAIQIGLIDKRVSAFATLDTSKAQAITLHNKLTQMPRR